MRWIDDDLIANEDFLGFYELPNIKSNTIVKAITDNFTRFNLPISDLCEQIYDGASKMLEPKSGVATQIIQPKALETHCHGHSLNLSIKDVTTSNRLINAVLGTVYEIVTLIRYSPKGSTYLVTSKTILTYKVTNLIILVA